MQIIKIHIQLIASKAGGDTVDVYVIKSLWGITPVFSSVVGPFENHLGDN